MTDDDANDPAAAPPPPAAPAVPLIGYEPASPVPPRLTARVIWWSLPAVAVLVVGAGLLLNPLVGVDEAFGMGLLGTPLMPFDQSADDWTQGHYGLTVTAYLAAFVLTQWLFLFPRGRLTLRADGPGRPLRRAALGAGFAGMLLTVGFVAVTLDVGRTWPWLTGAEGNDDADPAGPRFLGMPGLRPLHFVWAGMLFAWLAWAWVFYRFLRDADHQTGVGRVTKWLLAGTVLELLVAGPAHVWAVTRTDRGEYDCYCARGSYTGLVFGCTALLWLFGPGVFLLVLRERRRRERLVIGAAGG